MRFKGASSPSYPNMSLGRGIGGEFALIWRAEDAKIKRMGFPECGLNQNCSKAANDTMARDNERASAVVARVTMLDVLPSSAPQESCALLVFTCSHKIFSYLYSTPV